MNVVALNGSGREKKGLTWRLLDAFIDGLEKGNSDVVRYQVNALNINPCKSCFACMHNSPGKCVVDDDMNDLYSSLKKADLLVLATPVYTDSMSAQLKTVIDRCMCCMEPFLRIDKENRVRHSYAWRMPERFALISTCAFPEPETFDPLRATFRGILGNFGSENAGELCIPGSIALNIEQSLLVPYLDLIRQAGEELSTKGSISAELTDRINSPSFNREEYLEIVSSYEKWCRIRIDKTG